MAPSKAFFNFLFSLVVATTVMGPQHLEAKGLSQRLDYEELFLSQEESDQLTKDLPAAIQQLFVDEIDKNAFFQDEANAKEFERLEMFSPTEKRWFFLPYFEIPLDHIEKLNISDSIDPNYKKLFFFSRGGVKYIRYFVHPFRDMKNYESLLRKYDLVYKFVARPTSSPRSLIIVNPDDPETPEWVKVSLHVKITDLQRRQKLEKLARALAVNESLEAIEEDTLKKLNFGWLPEPLAVKLPKKEEVIIGRDVEPYIEAQDGGRRLRSTFAFFSEDENGEPEVARMIRKSKMTDFEFFEKYFIRPAVRVFAYLGFVEGIQWGMHTANYMTELNSRGLPTGRIVLKDFDGAWFDAEIRMLQGRSFEGIHDKMNAPFKEFLFPSATGRNSGERQHFGEIYNRYIRNASGFSSLGSLIYNYLVNHGQKKYRNLDKLKNDIQEAIDDVAIEEIERYTGQKFSREDMKGGHLKTNGLNRALNTLRAEMLDKTKREEADLSIQKVLKREFIRLSKLNRTWTSFSGTPEAIAGRFENQNVLLFFDQDSGMIQVRGYRSKDSDEYSIIGYALVEDPTSEKTLSFMRKLIEAKKKAKSCEDLMTSTIVIPMQIVEGPDSTPIYVVA